MKTKKPTSKGDELMKKYHNDESLQDSFNRQMRELQQVMSSPLNITKLLRSNEANISCKVVG
ncbi:hypothetical protein LCGC14_1125840 [marine sediment metagenome]|uniref:Uncharacterized protein n=1 Tax=marine sediment metagenome TaxID=412755 RepID=A0A0F9MQH8_9ZZZZ